MKNLKLGAQATVPLPDYPDLALAASSLMTSQLVPATRAAPRGATVDVTFDAGFAGEPYTVTRKITGIPQAPSANPVTKAWLTVKVQLADADPGKFQLAITTSLSAAGQITADGVAAGSGVATLSFTLTAANTGALTADQTYYYDIQVLLQDQTLKTVERGTIVFHARVTGAVS